MAHSLLGSIWRKWDLHFHTPSSYDYQNKSVTNKQIVDTLLAAQVEVVAVTDHHVIDVERLAELRKLAADKILFLPGIELRSELGKEPVHYIGIFPETANLEHIWDTIRGTLGLTPQGIRDKGGDDSVYVPIKDAYEEFKKLGGILSIHAGETSNSIDRIKNTEQFQSRIKYNVAKSYVDLLEIGQIRDVLSYKEIIFPKTGLEKPLVIGSDNHNINKYGTPACCWLKADPAFTGLRLVLNEPEDRVHLGDRPPSLAHVEGNPTRYIYGLSVNKREGSELPEEWFNGLSLEFNTGLIAIIGNKGSGKSALADTLGLLGDNPLEDSFSFLHKSQFRDAKLNKAQDFDATLIWRSGDPERKNLGDTVDDTHVERVRYIPQQHLEEICDELKGGKGRRFENELKRVIFSRIPPTDQYKTNSLDELIEYMTQESKDSVRFCLDELEKSISEAVVLEQQCEPKFLAERQEELKLIDKEIAAHDTLKPQEPNKPGTDPNREKTESRVEELNRLIGAYESQVVDLGKDQQEISKKMQDAQKVRDRLDNIKRYLEKELAALGPICSSIEIAPKDVLGFSIDTEPLDSIELWFSEIAEAIECQFDDEAEDTLAWKHARAESERNALIENLDRSQREYQSYLEALKQWEQNRASLVGAVDKPGTREYIKARISSATNAPVALEKHRGALIDAAIQIYIEKRSQLTVHEKLYAPVQDFIHNHHLARDRFGLEFSVTLNPVGFIDKLLSFIDRNRIGSFRGEKDGCDAAERLVAKADFNTEEGVRQFLSTVLDYLIHDRRPSEDGGIVTIASQLRQDFSVKDLYGYLLGLEYLVPRYRLVYEGKSLEQLSPGERGTLLLVIFLLIDDSGIPLVIDQPEGNLDNQTVFEVLTDCIKDAKKRRQVFIVTHNPNLAVVCDADQVIHAELDKKNGCRLTYTSGALENPDICQRIINVLEGTRPAIENRISKYKIVFDRS